MRVAYVSADPGVPVYGNKGCSIHVQEVVRALKAQGAQVEIFAARMGGGAPPGLEDVPVHALMEAVRGDTIKRERAAIRANRAFSHALKRHGPFDVVYERYSLWSFAGMRFAENAGIPGVLEVNAPLIEEQAEHRALCDRECATRIAAGNFRTAQTIVAVSAAVGEYVRQFAGTADRVAVIPNGVDPSRFLPPDRSARPARDDAFTIGFVGSLKPWHGLQTLVEAFADLRRQDTGARLLVVGDGPERAELEIRLKSLGVAESSQVTGAVHAHLVPALLSSMDAAVAPYSARPQFYFSPLKVLEYMAVGVPVVASRIGQIQELIADGQTGLLFEPDDVRALAERLRWLRDDPKLRLKLGAAAREAVLTHHSWLDVTQRIFAHAGITLPAHRMQARSTDALQELRC